METKVEVFYLDGTSEDFEGEITLLQGCFRVQKALKSTSTLVTVEDLTDSVYIPFTSIKKMVTKKIRLEDIVKDGFEVLDNPDVNTEIKILVEPM